MGWILALAEKVREAFIFGEGVHGLAFGGVEGRPVAGNEGGFHGFLLHSSNYNK